MRQKILGFDQSVMRDPIFLYVIQQRVMAIFHLEVLLHCLDSFVIIQVMVVSATRLLLFFFKNLSFQQTCQLLALMIDKDWLQYFAGTKDLTEPVMVTL